ncbi:MAG: nonstructural protein [Microviridae sp.]|nr:MAG: nonstructural protein [Microviridae sp.]
MFGPPFNMPARGQAVRAFSDLANDKNTQVGRHPSDFKLVEIATFDDTKGVYTSLEHMTLGFASDYVDLGNVTPIGVRKEG